MQALGKFAQYGLAPLLSGIGLLTTKAPKMPDPPKVATRDDARDLIAAQDKLARRRGGAADILTGVAGGEAAPGARDTLGS